MKKKTKMKKNFYGTKTLSIVDGGCINYDPDSLKDIVNAKDLTYNEYIKIQKRSLGKTRSYFEMCYYEIPGMFKGQIEKKTKDKICFQRIYVTGIYGDGEIFDGKEDHVWMDLTGFESFDIGDSLSFSAEIYRYIKTSNGKFLDYGLRDPYDIEKISSYELPTDDELNSQFLQSLICETCIFTDHCDRIYCPYDYFNKDRKNSNSYLQLIDFMDDLIKP